MHTLAALKRAALLFIVFLSMPLLATAAPAGKVMFAQDTMANDFRRNQVFEVRDSLSGHPDIEFSYTDAKGDTARMIRDIESAMRKQVDILVLGTNDADAVVPAIDKVMAAGIKVIVLDRGVNSSNYTTFINSDNEQIGKIGGDYIVKQLGGKGKVLLFEGLLTADVTQLRSKGFLDAVASYPEIEVIKRTGNYLRKDALVEMDKLLASGERVDAIFAESDSMLSGARVALPKHGVEASSLITVGCDYVSEAKQAILAGDQTGSVLFPLGGKATAEVVLKLLSGESVEKHISIPVELVTADNANQVTPVF